MSENVLVAHPVVVVAGHDLIVERGCTKAAVVRGRCVFTDTSGPPRTESRLRGIGREVMTDPGAAAGVEGRDHARAGPRQWAPIGIQLQHGMQAALRPLDGLQAGLGRRRASRAQLARAPVPPGSAARAKHHGKLSVDLDQGVPKGSKGGCLVGVRVAKALLAGAVARDGPGGYVIVAQGTPPGASPKAPMV